MQKLSGLRGQLLRRLAIQPAERRLFSFGRRVERPPQKVIARGGSLMGDVSDTTLLWAWCVRHVERLIEELHYHNVRTTALAVQVAWKSGDSTGGTASIPRRICRHRAAWMAISGADVDLPTALAWGLVDAEEAP